MPLGHFMLGVLGGLAAVAASLVAGQPVWMAALLYPLVGNLIWIATLLLHLLWDHALRPAPHAARPSRRGPSGLRPVNVGR